MTRTWRADATPSWSPSSRRSSHSIPCTSVFGHSRWWRCIAVVDKPTRSRSFSALGGRSWPSSASSLALRCATYNARIDLIVEEVLMDQADPVLEPGAYITDGITFTNPNPRAVAVLRELLL